MSTQGLRARPKQSAIAGPEFEEALRQMEDVARAEAAGVAALQDEAIIFRRLLGLGPDATRSEVAGAIAELKRRAKGGSGAPRNG